MQILAPEFTEGQFAFKLIQRSKNIAVYLKSAKPPKKAFSYETVHIRTAEAHTFPSGRSYPKREVYPNSEAWGTDGFTNTTLKDAQYRFNQLLSAIS